MKQSSKCSVLLAAVLTFIPLALPKDRSEDHDGFPPRIYVRVHNYAQVSSETLTQAEGRASEILGKAGVLLTWTNCDPTRGELGNPPECSRLMESTDLGVRIISRFRPIPGLSKGAMGFAAGKLATLYFSRIRDEAERFGVYPQDVLGPAIAHEIGHLLLRSAGHSPTGIMRARWRRADYEAPPLGAFKFNAKQAVQLRTEVRQRERQQEAVDPSLTAHTLSAGDGS